MRGTLERAYSMEPIKGRLQTLMATIDDPNTRELLEDTIDGTHWSGNAGATRWTRALTARSGPRMRRRQLPCQRLSSSRALGAKSGLASICDLPAA